MTFPRRLLLCVTALLLCAAAFAEETAGDLRKWIPGDGMVYGEISCLVIQRSPLYGRLIEKYPAFKKLMDKGRGQLGGYDGELDRLVVMFNSEAGGFALLCQFTRPFDTEKLIAKLDAAGQKSKYEKITIGGKPGYVTRGADTAFGRTCVVLLSDQLMLVCPENSAETMISGPKLSAALAGKLATGANGVFLRVIPGPATLPPEAEVRDYEATGVLNADASVSGTARVEMPDEEAAKTLEMQIRQGMMIGLGVLFADNSELGMDLMSQIKIKRAATVLTVNVKITEDMIDRLAEYAVAQAEKKRLEKIERQKRREERRRAKLQKKQQKQQQSAPSQPSAPSAAPAAAGTTTPAR